MLYRSSLVVFTIYRLLHNCEMEKTLQRKVMKWGMRIWHFGRDPSVNSSPNINTDPTFPVPSPYYILFSHNVLSQQEYHGRRHCGDHEAWVWSQSCDDTSETRPRQVLYSTVPIVISARDTLPTSQETLQLYPSPCLNSQNLRTQSRRLPRPFCPRPFPSPSRASTSKPRKQEIVHNAAISTVKKGVVDHSLLSREDESHANPGDLPPGDRVRAATPRRALLVPIKPGIGDGQLLPRTPCPDVMMRAVDQDTVQVCPPQCPFCTHTNTM